MTKVDVRDLALRALHTFWQAFLAVLGATWAASGLDLSQITDVASAKRFVVAALAAVAAAALSAVKTTLKAFTSPAAWSASDISELLNDHDGGAVAPVGQPAAPPAIP